MTNGFAIFRPTWRPQRQHLRWVSATEYSQSALLPSRPAIEPGSLALSGRTVQTARSSGDLSGEKKPQKLASMVTSSLDDALKSLCKVYSKANSFIATKKKLFKLLCESHFLFFGPLFFSSGVEPECRRSKDWNWDLMRVQWLKRSRKTQQDTCRPTTHLALCLLKNAFVWLYLPPFIYFGSGHEKVWIKHLIGCFKVTLETYQFPGWHSEAPALASAEAAVENPDECPPEQFLNTLTPHTPSTHRHSGFIHAPPIALISFHCGQILHIVHHYLLYFFCYFF